MRFKVIGIFLIISVLLLSAVSAEARTFRKPVSNQEAIGDQPSAISNEPQTTNYKPQTAQDSQNCEPTIKRIRGKRVVTNNCASPIQNLEKKNPQIKYSDAPSNDALIVFNANKEDVKKIVQFVKDNGGSVSSVYEFKYAFAQNTNPQLENELKARFGSQIYAIYRNKVSTASLASDDRFIFDYWNSKFEPKKEGTSLTNAKPIYNDMVIPLDKNGEPPKISGLPSDTHTSEYMFGNVQVSIILPESNGAIDTNREDWTSATENEVMTEIPAAFDWWEAQATSMSTLFRTDLTFWWEKHLRVPTSYEPITRTAGGILSDEHLWINEIMENFGVPWVPYHVDRVRMYSDRIRDNNGWDWGFTIFVINSIDDIDGNFSGGGSAYAYRNGPFVTMTYDNGEWNINRMRVVAAHEIGHIFGALDQYYAGGMNWWESCTAKSGFLQVENRNYNKDKVNGCPSKVDSIMRSTESSYIDKRVDQYARGQIGWWDQDSDGIVDVIDRTYNSDDIDSDGDGIINYWDLCPSTSGIPERRGCPPDSPPTVSAVANPNPVGVGQTVTYTANANDDNSVSKIEISVDGIFVNTCYPNQPSASCPWSTSYPATGTHSFYANAIDNAGNPVSTTVQTLQVVDASMPSVSISASPSPVGVGQTVTFTASASDDIQVAIIRIIVDGGTFRECLITAPSGSCPEVTSYGATGTHTYRGFARDSSGNEVSTPEYILTVQQQPGVGPNPVAKISVNKNPVYTGETFTFTVTAQDDVQINTVWVYVEPDGSDALQLQNTCPGSGASGSCSWTSSFSTAKQHKFQGCTVDNENRFDCDPDSGWYLLDVITPPPPPSPPTVSVSASPAPVEVGQTITITANANDNAQVATIKIILDGVEVNSCPINAASGSCAYPASYASIGTHTYYATATDNEGSVGRDPASGTKGFNVVDTTIPTITASATPNPVDVGQLINLNATVSDNLKVAWAAIYIDGLLARNCTISKQSGWCSHTPSYSATGAHTYYALAADISGNRGQTPIQNFNVVDNNAPAIAVSAPATVKVNSPITITGNASDNAKVASISIFVDGTEAKNCTINAGSGSCPFTATYGNIGTHTYYAVAVDASGNSGRDPISGTKSFDVVDNIGPVIQPLLISTADMAATITASATDNIQLSEIKIFVDGAVAKTCPLASVNGTCVYANTWLVSGMHTAYATAADNAGNTATAPTKNFTVGKPGVIVELQGQGWVTSFNNDIQCGFIFNDCAKNYTNFGDKITLAATPSPSPLYVFDGWGGSCSGTSKTCTVTMNSTEKVYASFSPAKIPQFYELNVSVMGSGTGKVVSAPTGISCTSGLCSTLFKKGATVTLTATPNGGSTFNGWSGVCSGTAATCAVSMSASKSVAATFS